MKKSLLLIAAGVVWLIFIMYRFFAGMSDAFMLITGLMGAVSIIYFGLIFSIPTGNKNVKLHRKLVYGYAAIMILLVVLMFVVLGKMVYTKYF